MKLKQVAQGKVLHLPLFIAEKDRTWLNAGGVVDLDDPFVARAVQGQEYKLVDAPAGAVVSPISNRKLQIARDRFPSTERVTDKSIPPDRSKERATIAAGAPKAAGIQKPDTIGGCK